MLSVVRGGNHPRGGCVVLTSFGAKGELRPDKLGWLVTVESASDYCPVWISVVNSVGILSKCVDDTLVTDVVRDGRVVVGEQGPGLWVEVINLAAAQEDVRVVASQEQPHVRTDG